MPGQRNKFTLSSGAIYSKIVIHQPHRNHVRLEQEMPEQTKVSSCWLSIVRGGCAWHTCSARFDTIEESFRTLWFGRDVVFGSTQAQLAEICTFFLSKPLLQEGRAVQPQFLLLPRTRRARERGERRVSLALGQCRKTVACAPAPARFGRVRNAACASRALPPPPPPQSDSARRACLRVTSVGSECRAAAQCVKPRARHVRARRATSPAFGIRRQERATAHQLTSSSLLYQTQQV